MICPQGGRSPSSILSVNSIASVWDMLAASMADFGEIGRLGLNMAEFRDVPWGFSLRFVIVHPESSAQRRRRNRCSRSRVNSMLRGLTRTSVVGVAMTTPSGRRAGGRAATRLSFVQRSIATMRQAAPRSFWDRQPAFAGRCDRSAAAEHG
jgi:hypothetical protein